MTAGQKMSNAACRRPFSYNSKSNEFFMVDSESESRFFGIPSDECLLQGLFLRVKLPKFLKVPKILKFMNF